MQEPFDQKMPWRMPIALDEAGQVPSIFPYLILDHSEVIPKCVPSSWVYISSSSKAELC